MKFADDTRVVGQISNDNETTYRVEVEKLVTWSTEKKNLTLNVKKTKEIIVDFGAQGRPFDLNH